MRLLFAVLLAIHGAIHLVGFVKAFGLAELPRFGSPVTRPNGLVWLGAGVMYFATVVLLSCPPNIGG